MKRKHLHIAIILLLLFSCKEEKVATHPRNEKPIDKVSTYNLELTSHVYLNCEVNDTIPGVFLFDTGANGLVLDKKFLIKNNLAKNIRSAEVESTYGVGEGKTKHQSITDISLRIDNKRFSNLELRVMPLDSIFGEILNHRIDGIIGYDIFDNYLIELNFDKLKFTLEDSLNESVSETYSKLIYTNKYRKPIVDVILLNEQTKPIQCNLIFDMGSGRGVSLTHRKGNKENLFTADMNCEKDSIGGMGGKSISCTLPAKSISISGNSLKLDSIEIGKDKHGALGTHNMYDGLLGMRIIENFNVVINPTKNELWLGKRNSL